MLALVRVDETLEDQAEALLTQDLPRGEMTENDKLDLLVDALLSRVKQRGGDDPVFSAQNDIALAILRDRVARLQTDLTERIENDRRQDQLLAELREQNVLLRTELDNHLKTASLWKNKGFWGAVAAFVTAIGAAITAWWTSKGPG